jgi:superfamily II DNA helicase RecQ
MSTKHGDPGPVLLCQPTGGGKSMVRDTFAASSPGVTINIAPLLSLSADQHSKFMQKRQTPQVFSLHLDAYRTTSQQKEICALLLGVASHGSLSTSVVVFSSAQAFTDNPIYRAMLHSILNMKLVLVCIDEVHLFVQFGLWFRSEFVRLSVVQGGILVESLRFFRSTSRRICSLLYSKKVAPDGERVLVPIQIRILLLLPWSPMFIYWGGFIKIQQGQIQRTSHSLISYFLLRLIVVSR